MVEGRETVKAERLVAYAQTSPALKVLLYCSREHVPGGVSHAITVEDARELRKEGRLDIPALCGRQDCRQLIWDMKELGNA